MTRVALLSGRPVVDCPTCEGTGHVEFTHPLWGTYHCPEPTDLVLCDECGGMGEIPKDDEDGDDDRAVASP